jgi:4-hydroxy-tetrahydrodipicolinate synthase
MTIWKRAMAVNLISRTVTIFAADGSIDEAANRVHLARFVDNKLGVYLASGGSGEGFALSHDELRRVYEIGVAECKGKVPVYANPPEQHTAKATVEQSLIAAGAGVEVINVYPLAGWHGMRPRDEELVAYYDDVLPHVRHPIALSINPITGYTPSPKLMANVAKKYSQVVAINFFGVNDTYLINFKDMMNRDLDLYFPVPGSLNALTSGATGLLGAAANVIPATHRRYIDCYEAGRLEEIGVAYAHIERFSQLAGKWGPSNARWVKMCLRVLGMPGGEGVLRPPYQMPSEADLQEFCSALLKLDNPEINALAGKWGSKYTAKA